MFVDAVKDTIIFINDDRSLLPMRSIGMALQYISSLRQPHIRYLELAFIPTDASLLARCRTIIVRNVAYTTYFSSLRNLRATCDDYKISLVYLNDIPIVAGEDGIEQITPDYLGVFAKDAGYTIERSTAAMRCM